jgi:serine/threonine protein phosphatase PrpC
MQVDSQFNERHSHSTCGTTATAAVLQGQKLWVAHVGDSRAVLGSRNGDVSVLTKDHKPDDAEEAMRIRVRLHAAACCCMLCPFSCGHPWCNPWVG